MRKPDAPCKGCEQRRLRCHATCVKYAAFCDNNEKYKNTVREAKDLRHDLETIAVQRSRRAKKSSGKVK